MRLKYPYAKHKLNHNDIRFGIKALKSGILSRGKFTQQLEQKLCEITGARFAVAVSSGTAALHCAYLVIDKPLGTKVFSSPITFASALTTAALSGLNPCFVDIEKNYPQISVDELQKSITSQTVICPTSLTGQTFKQKEIWELAKANNSIVIADHAHSLGGKFKVDNQVYPTANANFADLATLSFQATKIITGGGEGGAIITNNETYYRHLLAIRSQGMVYDSNQLLKKNEGIHYHEMQFPGLNYRLTEMQAALCLSQLNRLDELVGKRNEIASWYFKTLENVDFIQLPLISDFLPAWHLFAIRVQRRNDVATALRKRGIGTQVHYLPVYKHPWFQKKGFTETSPCINAEIYYKETLSLPMHIHLRKKDVLFICEQLMKAVENEN